MNALLHFIKLNVEKAINKLRWPTWYHTGSIILLALIPIEVAPLWLPVPWLMLGFIVWGFGRVK